MISCAAWQVAGSAIARAVEGLWLRVCDSFWALHSLSRVPVWVLRFTAPIQPLGLGWVYVLGLTSSCVSMTVIAAYRTNIITTVTISLLL